MTKGKWCAMKKGYFVEVSICGSIYLSEVAADSEEAAENAVKNAIINGTDSEILTAIANMARIHIDNGEIDVGMAYELT